MKISFADIRSRRAVRVAALAIVAIVIGLQSARGQTSEINYLMGNFEPAAEPDFVVIDKAYTNKDRIYLRKETYAAFKKMYAAALKATRVKLTIISGTRNFSYQKRIWERKWKENESIADHNARSLEILKYSAMPGASRHHWGSDIDLVTLKNSYFSSGKGKEIYEWLKENASTYGFCQPYTALSDPSRTGYQEEKWHWSYMPLSQDHTARAGTLIANTMIKGFSGSETATQIDIVNKYILGVNSQCK